MAEKKKYDRTGRTTVDLHGEELRQAIELRHIMEDVAGVPVKMSVVVREAIREKYLREVGGIDTKF